MDELSKCKNQIIILQDSLIFDYINQLRIAQSYLSCQPHVFYTDEYNQTASIENQLEIERKKLAIKLMLAKKRLELKESLAYSKEVKRINPNSNKVIHLPSPAYFNSEVSYKKAPLKNKKMIVSFFLFFLLTGAVYFYLNPHIITSSQSKVSSLQVLKKQSIKKATLTFSHLPPPISPQSNNFLKEDKKEIRSPVSMPLKKINQIPHHFTNINAFVLAGNRTIFIPKESSNILQAIFPNSATNLAVENYKKIIHNKVKSNRVYPSRDKRRGNGGKVTAQFTVLRNGLIKNLKLTSSATSISINRAAISAIKKSSPFKAFPISIRNESLNVIIPFSFTVNNY